MSENEKGKDKEKDISFEEAMEQLEQIVQQLEAGDVPLEKSIELFQSGMALSSLCSKKLEQVEKKIDILVDENGQLEKKSFQQLEDEQGDLA